MPTPSPAWAPQAVDLLTHIVRKLPASVLMEFYHLLLFPLVTRLANEEAPLVRRLLPSCIAALLARLPPTAADQVAR